MWSALYRWTSPHLGLAILALALGAYVFVRPKGGRAHRWLGRVYAIALLLVNVTALATYEDSAGPGPFHVLAVVSLATLAAGVLPVLLRRPRGAWLQRHGYFMSWSYVGLVAAGCGQMATLYPVLGDLGVALSAGLVVLVGGLLVHTRVPRVLASLTGRGTRSDDSREATRSPRLQGCRR